MSIQFSGRVKLICPPNSRQLLTNTLQQLRVAGIHAEEVSPYSDNPMADSFTLMTGEDLAEYKRLDAKFFSRFKKKPPNLSMVIRFVQEVLNPYTQADINVFDTGENRSNLTDEQFKKVTELLKQ